MKRKNDLNKTLTPILGIASIGMIALPLCATMTGCTIKVNPDDPEKEGTNIININTNPKVVHFHSSPNLLDDSIGDFIFEGEGGESSDFTISLSVPDFPLTIFRYQHFLYDFDEGITKTTPNWIVGTYIDTVTPWTDNNEHPLLIKITDQKGNICYESNSDFRIQKTE